MDRGSHWHARCRCVTPCADPTKSNDSEQIISHIPRQHVDSTAIAKVGYSKRRATSGQMSNNALARNLSHQPIFTTVRLAWETLNYAWDTRVLSFDAEAQHSFVAEIGIADGTPVSLIIRTLLIAPVLLAVYVAWMWWQTLAQRSRQGIVRTFLSQGRPPWRAAGSMGRPIRFLKSRRTATA